MSSANLAFAPDEASTSVDSTYEYASVNNSSKPKRKVCLPVAANNVIKFPPRVPPKVATTVHFAPSGKSSQFGLLFDDELEIIPSLRDSLNTACIVTSDTEREKLTSAFFFQQVDLNEEV